MKYLERRNTSHKLKVFTVEKHEGSKQPSMSSAPKPVKEKRCSSFPSNWKWVFTYLSAQVSAAAARFGSLSFCWEAAKPGAKVNDTSSKEKDSFIM